MTGATCLAIASILAAASPSRVQLEIDRRCTGIDAREVKKLLRIELHAEIVDAPVPNLPAAAIRCSDSGTVLSFGKAKRAIDLARIDARARSRLIALAIAELAAPKPARPPAARSSTQKTSLPRSADAPDLAEKDDAPPAIPPSELDPIDRTELPIARAEPSDLTPPIPVRPPDRIAVPTHETAGDDRAVIARDPDAPGTADPPRTDPDPLALAPGSARTIERGAEEMPSDPEPPLAATVVREEVRTSSGSSDLHFAASLLGGLTLFTAAGPPSFGGRIAVELAPSVFGVRFDAGAYFGSERVELGDVSLLVAGAGLSGFGRFAASSFVVFDVSAGARAGLARVRGTPIDPNAIEGATISGAWVGPFLGARATFLLDPILIVADLEAGLVIRPVVGRAEDLPVAAADGAWFGFHLGVGLEP